jgi:flavorubredoxin
MRAIKLTDRVYWVGAIDWGLRNFHGYTTSSGSTYNAYLVIADKITLVDTVKAPFRDEMMSRISSLIDPKAIDFIISNHAEMDHSGCLSDLMREVNPEKVFASIKGVEALNQHFDFDREITPVPDGETLDLGGAKFSFGETRMLHWPDSMVSYLHGDGVLFSQDGFGMHLASNERFDDQIDPSILKSEASKYFANILTPFSPIVLKTLEKIKGFNFDIKFIAPDHGPVWRKDIEMILDMYVQWAKQEPTKKAVVVYDTMWQSTAKMARTIGEGIFSTGVCTKVMPLAGNSRSDIATELLDAGAVVVGSPTMNNQLYPTVADVLTYTKGLKFKNLIGAAFGSYGWSGEAVKLIEENLREMKVDLVAEALNVKYVPSKDDYAACFKMGTLIGEKLNSA